MLKTFSYYDITNLSKKPKQVKFIFEGVEYNTFYGNRDKSTLLINSYKDTSFSVKKLTTFIYDINKRLGIDSTPIVTPTPKPQPQPIYSPLETLKKITDTKELSIEFLETMQLSNIFKADYESHPNIKKYDNKHEILYYTDGTRHNARFKWNGKYKFKKWSTFRKDSGFESIGAFIEGANKSRTTLMLLEGLKDGINGNIALPQCDILATDSKNIKLSFNLLKKEYKTIILFQDKELSEKEIIKLFGELKGEDRKILNKIYYIDTNRLPNNVKDITDFLESLDRTAKGLKRDALKEIKKLLHKERVKQLENALEISEKIDPIIENAKKFNNISLFKEMVQKKLKLRGDITEDIKYYIKKQVTPPSSHKRINLSSSKYLGNVTSQIIEEFKAHNKIILGSPTGTGKSTFSKGFIMNNFKNVIIIAPLKKVSHELSEHTENDLKAYKSANISTPKITHIENNEKIDAVMANINSPYLSITTDTFYNLLNNKMTKGEVKERLAKCELIVFDEQHIVHQSHNFRGKVVWVNDYLRDNYNGKVLSMSGTPIYSDLPNYHPILCKLDKRYFSKIDYFLDPFKDENHLMQNMREELKKGNVLLYSKSRTQAKYIQKFLIESDINTLLVTSRGNSKKMVNDFEEIEIDDGGINAIDENMAIVSTTRATTGTNFKNLSVIYQFGSAYDPHTFIQLMARIRGNGKYYFIKTAGDKAQDESLMNKAINILTTAKRFNLKKISDLFRDATKQQYIKKNIELPYQEHNLEAFLRTYKRSLSMIASEGLGKEDNEDFEFTNRLDEIEEKSFSNIFKNGDSAEFTKYIEREMIDFLQRKGDIEILNHAYNLSFEIVHNNKELDYTKVDSKTLITLSDATEKEQKAEERKIKLEGFKSDIINKFDWLLNSKNQSAFFNVDKGGFSSGEIATLLDDKRIDNIEVQKEILKGTRTNKEKFTRLKFFLIPKKIIIKETFEPIKIKEFVTVNELSTILEQKVRLTMRKGKAPFSQFIKDFLKDENITKSGLELYKQKRINGKIESNVITLPKEQLKEIKSIKDQEQRESKRIEELNRVMELQIKAICGNEDIEVTFS